HLAYERSADSYPFEVVSVEDRDIPNGLLDYAEEIGADLITIVNRRRSRWQAVLRPTLTQQLALRARLPVLVLHTDKELQPTPKPTEYQEHYY
ncbi:MAG: universal stress protein, partial [Bacteroidota bacterium]